jgi:hypothetical protein
MNDELQLGSPLDRYGRIVPVRQMARVTGPVIGHVIRMEDGFYACSCIEPETMARFDGKVEAITWLGNRDRGRK